MPLNRRAVVTGVIASASAFSARAGTVTDTDVIIIGAGFAGISAARQLKASGVRAIIIESRDRVGGRAYTDTQTLGRRFDRGAYWLHSKAINPLVPLARQDGMNLIESSNSDGEIFDQGTASSEVFMEAVSDAGEAWERRQAVTSSILKDSSLGATLPNPTLAQRFVKNIFAVEMGDDPDLISRKGYNMLEGGEDLVPETGMGPLAQGLASGLDIRLNCPVSAVVWDGNHGVTVKGSFGQLTARKIIITAPTGVLVTGAIRFDPALPQATQAAISNLPMGAFEKHAMVLSQAMPDLPEFAISKSHVEQGLYHALLVSPDKKMVTALIPGPVSRRLFAEGLPAIEAFADDLVKNVIGTRARVEARATTHWQLDPFARGSYAYSRVGHSDAREIYAQPVDDRLFFTGDGADDPLAVSVGGAWRNGQKAARSVARLLGAKRG